MANCFCGCGRQLRGSYARVSKFGERHDRALAALETRAMRGLQLRADETGQDYAEAFAALTKFISDGKEMREHLVDVAHGEVEVGPHDRRIFHKWQRIAFKLSGAEFRHRKRWKRERVAAGEKVELKEAMGPSGLARGMEPEEAAEAYVAAYGRGLAAGLTDEEVMDRIIAAWTAGKELPF